MKGKAFWIGGVVVLMLALGVTIGIAQSESTDFRACVNSASGTIKMIGPGETCNDNNELLIEWNQVGPEGPAGADGADGAQGLPQTCVDGQMATYNTSTLLWRCVDPVVGADGLVGPAGPQGPDGSEGPQGDQGPLGLTGATGPAGADGATGPIGPAGNLALAGQSCENDYISGFDDNGNIICGIVEPEPNNPPIWLRPYTSETLIAGFTDGYGTIPLVAYDPDGDTIRFYLYSCGGMGLDCTTFLYNSDGTGEVGITIDLQYPFTDYFTGDIIIHAIDDKGGVSERMVHVTVYRGD